MKELWHPLFCTNGDKKLKHGKRDRHLKSKEGKTMSHLVQKPPSHYHHKKPPAMLMYLLVYQKAEIDQTNTGKLTKTSYIIIT